MTVYIVSAYYVDPCDDLEDGITFVKVFSTKEKAEEFLKEEPGGEDQFYFGWNIEEQVVN